MSNRGNALDALFPNVKQSQADTLVALARGSAKGFCRAGGDDAATYGTIKAGDTQQTWPIQSTTFRLWLSRLFYEQQGKSPNKNSLQDAIDTLDADARFGQWEYPIAVRLAAWGGDIYLDLCDAAWRIVHIGESGWRLIGADDCPGHFIRKAGSRPLPEPERGGTIDELRECLNVPGDDAWRLLVGWMLMALNPAGPFPLLCVDGEQGSGKTGLCRMVRDILDPNAAPLRRPPKNEQDLMIAANNGWIVAYDNLSGIKPELSDSLCGLATGTGFATRTLYSDSDETIFSARRPIIVNGIENLASRSDLADRAVHLTLPTIPPHRRRPETEIAEHFEQARGRILGALLDGVVEALRNQPYVELQTAPRMADFAIWVTAAEPGLDWEPGAFMESYERDRHDAHAEAVESAAIGPAVLRLIDRHHGRWSGTATAMQSDLRRVAQLEEMNRQGWPRSPKGVSGLLRRLAPNLRALGVETQFTVEGADRRRVITISRTVEPERSPNAPDP